MVDADAFHADRPRLFSIAYRMLGSASEAEDVVQDAWLRYSAARDAEVRSPRAFAATIVTRLCLDRLKSAHARREQYVGPWLPEPVLTDDRAPDRLVERAESVTLAFLVVLDALSPQERAVFLLKEIFGYEHAEIARMLTITAANSRQLHHRARTKVRAARPAPAATGDRRRIAERFAQALGSGDAAALAGLLTSEVSFVSDGGGKVPAARRPFSGRDEVLLLLTGLQRTANRTGLLSQVAVRIAEVNSEPALLLWVDRQLDGVWVLTTDGSTISRIQVIRNPDKLTYLRAQLESTPGGADNLG